MPESAACPTNAFRQEVLRNYHDHAQVTVPHDTDTDLQCGDQRKGPKGGVKVPFPTKLHLMISKVEGSGLRHVVSWWDPLHLVCVLFFRYATQTNKQCVHCIRARQPHGRCFVVHKPKEFVADVMPTYFRQSKLTSFQRQLNLYGFVRITKGPDRGGYYHELFLRHKLFLCATMVRYRLL